MKQQLEHIQHTFQQELQSVEDAFGLERLEEQFFSRKSGLLPLVMKALKDLSDDERKEMGQAANEVKQTLEALLKKKKDELSFSRMNALAHQEAIDVSRPFLPKKEYGHVHPVTRIQRQIEDFFTSMGFMIFDGPELESEFFNFESLNIPADHPAREMQDTFYIKTQHSKFEIQDDSGDGENKKREGGELLMRTHTSTMQVRAMREFGVPLRVIQSGRCFRNEATDARHEHTFFQLDGIMVGTDISFSHMKGILEAVAKHLYGKTTQVRLRPKFYPFVEPGVNGEVTCFLCKGKGCRVCKQSGWLEIFGAGMVHPHVLKAGGVDPAVYRGFAFGFGLSRLVMLSYGIEDVRHFLSGDMRFLHQF